MYPSLENGVYNSFEDEHREPKDQFKLPPKWIDIYDETKDELSKIKEISNLRNHLKILKINRQNNKSKINTKIKRIHR